MLQRSSKLTSGLLGLAVVASSFAALPTPASAAVALPTAVVDNSVAGQLTVTATYAVTGDVANTMAATAKNAFLKDGITFGHGDTTCSKGRTGSEASTSCTMTMPPGVYTVEAFTLLAGVGASPKVTFPSVEVLGTPAAPYLPQSCMAGIGGPVPQNTNCGGYGLFGISSTAFAPGYTAVRMAMWRTPSYKRLSTGGGGHDVGTVTAFDPTSTAFFYNCDGNFLQTVGGAHQYFLMRATSVDKVNCLYSGATPPADNLVVATKGSGGNQVGQALGGILVDGSGNLFVSDQSNSRVAKWTSANTTGGGSGVTFAGTGTSGSALNQLKNPGQVALDGSGNLYVADAGNHRVLRFPANSTSSTNGTVVAGGNGSGTALNQLNGAQGIALDSSGNLYVADSNNCRVLRFPANSTSSTSGMVVVAGSGCTPFSELTTAPTKLLINETAHRLYVQAPAVGGIGYSPTFGYVDLTSGSYYQLWHGQCTALCQSLGSWVNGVSLDLNKQPVLSTSDGDLYSLDLTGDTIYCDKKLGSYTSTSFNFCLGSQRALAEHYWADQVYANALGYGAHSTVGNFYGGGWQSAPASVAKPTLKPRYKALEVAWTPATTGDPASTYEVTLKDAKGATAGTCTANAPDTSCVVSGLDPKVRYTATVVAKNPRGDAKASAASSPGSPYDLPATMVAPVGTALARSASVSFTPPSTTNGGPATSYTVTAGPGGATCTVNAPATSCVVPGLTPGQPYTFTVAASNDGGTGPSSPASNAVTPFDNPSKPSKPTLTAGDGGVLVKGSSSATDGGSPITGYTATIYDNAGNVAGTCDYVDPAVGCAVPGLDNGTAYTAKVVTHNAGGDSTASDPSSPATPSGPPASPPNLHVTATGDGGVDLAWDAPASNGGSSITGYVLTQFPSAGTCTVDNAARTARCTGLANGTPYDFSVAATNAAGTGPVSNTDTGTPMTVPSAPVAPTVKAGNGSVTVTWKKPASDGGSAIKRYTVTVGGKTCVTTGSSCTITGLPNGSAVTAVVKATNGVGDSADSAASASVTPTAPAGAPQAPFQAPTVTAGNAKLDVSLTDFSPGATGVVFTAGPGGQSCIAKTMPYRCTIPGVDNGTEYTVTAAFMNAKGTGSQSAASSPATPLGPPSAPLGLIAKGANGSLKVSWAYPANDGGSAVTSYTVTVRDAKGKVAGTCTYTVVDPPANTCNVAGLSTSEAYVVEVTATNANGTGPKATLTDVLAPIAFNSLTAPTSKLQVAVGDHSQAYRSSDAGAHWSVDSTPTLENLNGVSCGGGGTFCMAVGENGTILTWDAASAPASGAQPWAVLSSGTSEDFKGVACIMDGACVAVATNATVATSDPAAAKAAPSAVKVIDASDAFGVGGSINAVTCTNPKAPAKPVCLIAGAGGHLVAVPWKGAASGFGQPAVLDVKNVTTELTALRCSVDTNCVAVGRSGTVLYGTKDIAKAASWKKLGTIKGFDATKDLRGVACPALSQLCMAVGQAGTVLVSNPKKPAGPGTTGWVPVASGVSYDLTNVRCVSQTACLGIGGGHLIQVVLAKTGTWVVRQVA